MEKFKLRSLLFATTIAAIAGLTQGIFLKVGQLYGWPLIEQLAENKKNLRCSTLDNQGYTPLNPLSVANLPILRLRPWSGCGSVVPPAVSPEPDTSSGPPPGVASDTIQTELKTVFGN
jgi:hypothetical protein